jgi:hypothetical protein
VDPTVSKKVRGDTQRQPAQHPGPLGEIRQRPVRLGAKMARIAARSRLAPRVKSPSLAGRRATRASGRPATSEPRRHARRRPQADAIGEGDLDGRRRRPGSSW